MLTLEYLGPDGEDWEGVEVCPRGGADFLSYWKKPNYLLTKFPTMLTLEYPGTDGEGWEGVEACPRGGAELPGGPGPAREPRFNTTRDWTYLYLAYSLSLSLFISLSFSLSLFISLYFSLVLSLDSISFVCLCLSLKATNWLNYIYLLLIYFL